MERGYEFHVKPKGLMIVPDSVLIANTIAACQTVTGSIATLVQPLPWLRNRRIQAGRRTSGDRVSVATLWDFLTKF